MKSAQQRFGRFEILRRLGRSMTDVYLARDVQCDRTVVLKVVENVSDAGSRETAEAEKRGAAIQQQLGERNGHILKVYDFGEKDGCFFVALEYFPGRTLAEILQTERTLPPQRAARYAAQICRQLRTLHEWSSASDGTKTAIIHGDIKPSNIQVNAYDELRLLDFGIAKLIRPGHDLTHHQLGSPSYCSPERLRESRVDVHADLWALGVTTYEMLAGSPPFQAADTRQLEKLIQLRQLPRELPGSCPAALRAIVGRALSAELNHRYGSAAAFEADLQSFLNEAGQPNGMSVATKTSEATSVAFAPAKDEPKKSRRAFDLSNVAIGLLAGILAGLLLCVPAAAYFRLEETGRFLGTRKDYTHLPASVLAADWQHYQTIAHQSGWLKRLVPVEHDVAAFRENLLDSAETLIARFRRGSEDQLNLGWSEPRLLLLYAYEIDRSDRRVEGELRLCDGYLHFKNAQDPRAGLKEFRRAAALLPHSPDPHLGLAYAYVYNLHNVSGAIAEFDRATQNGYRLLPRDRQQKADAYLFRAESALNRAKRLPKTARHDVARWLELAHADFEQARSLYEPIASFGQAAAHLEQVRASEDDQAKFETALQESARPKTHMVLLKMKYVSRAGASRWR